jgi:hypothetical protein
MVSSYETFWKMCDGSELRAFRHTHTHTHTHTTITAETVLNYLHIMHCYNRDSVRNTVPEYFYIRKKCVWICKSKTAVFSLLVQCNWAMTSISGCCSDIYNIYIYIYIYAQELSERRLGRTSWSTFTMKITAFWDTEQCSLVRVDRRFRGAYCLNHQGEEAESSFRNVVVLLFYNLDDGQSAREPFNINFE